MSEKQIISKNSDLLFLYDAEMCNPNGDPDNENKPRMDYLTSTNLVTDVRLKRYIRDYMEKYKKKSLYLTNPEGIVLNATNRLKFYLWRKNNPQKEYNEEDMKKEKPEEISTSQYLEYFDDIRLFGVTCPIKPKEEGQKGSSVTFTGPVQFNWGKSLNEVEIVDSSGITTHLSSESGSQGSMGQDFRVHYSLIAFHGIVNSKRAELTKMTSEDLQLLEESLIKSIPLLATRSKVGQQPRLFFRIEYKNNNHSIGDLRKYLSLENTKGLRSIQDVQLDNTKLMDKIKSNKDIIARVRYWIDPLLKFTKEIPKNELFEEIKIE